MKTSSHHLMKATDDCKPEPNGYTCDLCNYNTPRKDQYIRHLLSDKHITRADSNGKLSKSCARGCSCGKPHK